MDYGTYFWLVKVLIKGYLREGIYASPGRTYHTTQQKRHLFQDLPPLDLANSL